MRRAYRNGEDPCYDPRLATTMNEVQNPLVSILLVSYNSKRYMDACLEALQRHVRVPFEVLLVDNGSTDGTADHVRAAFPSVRVFQSETNLGFTGGNNLAAQRARGTFLLLLNCDTVLLTDIAPGLRILEEDARVGVVGARMYGQYGELRANTGHFPKPWRLWKFTLQWSKPLKQPLGEPALAAFRHDWVEGSFLLTRRENWEAVGGMDESGFMYTEDVEFCAHTRERGLLTVQCARLMYLHFGGYTVERMSYLYAGYRRFHASCSSPGMRRRAEWVLLLGLAPRLVVFGLLTLLTRRPAFGKKFQRFAEVLRSWKSLAPKPSTRRPLPQADGLRGLRRDGLRPSRS